MSLQLTTIAIPTHRRPEVFRENTFALLERAGWPCKVDLFLSDEEDAAAYAQFASDNVRLIVPAAPIPSLTVKLNIIHNHYPLNAPVVVIEDDMKHLVKKNDNKVEKCDAELGELIREGFRGAIQHQIPLWGVGPSANGMFLKEENSTSLKLVVGYLFGFFCTKAQSLELTLPVKTDYERTVRYFQRFGKVFRVNRYSLLTKSYKNPGGLNAQATNRAELEEQSVAWLVANFGKYLARNEARASQYAELKFLRQ